MVWINSKEELYRYLDNFDWEEKKETEISSVYFLIEYNNKIAPIYFCDFEDYWLEYPCTLVRTEYTKEELEEYISSTYKKEYLDLVRKYVNIMYRDGYFYEIECYQNNFFLPERLIILEAMTESECLNWLL